MASKVESVFCLDYLVKDKTALSKWKKGVFQGKKVTGLAVTNQTTCYYWIPIVKEILSHRKCNLTCLDLSNNRLKNDQFAEFVTPLLKQRMLKKLTLQRNMLTRVCIPSLIGLLTWCSLEELDLAYNDLMPDEDLEHDKDLEPDINLNAIETLIFLLKMNSCLKILKVDGPRDKLIKQELRANGTIESILFTFHSQELKWERPEFNPENFKIDDANPEKNLRQLDRELEKCLKKFSGAYNPTKDALITSSVQKLIGEPPYQDTVKLWAAHNNIDGLVKEDGKTRCELDGLYSSQFISARIKFLFTLLLGLRTNQITDDQLPQSIDAPEKMKESKVRLSCFLFEKTKKELLIQMIAFGILKQCEALEEPDDESKYTPIAENIIGLIEKLKVEEEYSFEIGHEEHSMYLSFTRYDKDHVLVRVDNVGDGIEHGHEVLNDDEGKASVKPRFLGIIEFRTIDNLKIYITQVLWARSKSSETAFAFIYRNENLQLKEAPSELKERFPLQRIQRAMNCVQRSSDAALGNRWGIEGFKWFHYQGGLHLSSLGSLPDTEEDAAKLKPRMWIADRLQENPEYVGPTKKFLQILSFVDRVLKPSQDSTPLEKRMPHPQFVVFVKMLTFIHTKGFGKIAQKFQRQGHKKLIEAIVELLNNKEFTNFLGFIQKISKLPAVPKINKFLTNPEINGLYLLDLEDNIWPHVNRLLDSPDFIKKVMDFAQEMSPEKE